MAENSLRQLGPPRIGKFADRQRPEPMHLEVNNWQHLLDVIYLLLLLQDDCFEQFYEVLSNPTKDGGCGEKFVADHIKEHYNSADKFKKIPLRLIGKQAIALARYSFRIMDILIKKSDVRDC